MAEASIRVYRVAFLLSQILVAVQSSREIGTVFTRAEADLCGYEHGIRIPQMTLTPTGVLALGQCRNAQGAGGAGTLKDDMSQTKIVSKFSKDMGKTWGPMKFLTDKVGHSHGQVVYDRVRKRVLFQYQFHPSVNPEFNSTYFQKISSDDGQTWGQKRDVTDLLRGCNPSAPNHMQVITAGAKIQTSSGRILFAGHGDQGLGCRWWTDDGGNTYNTSSQYPANEVSLAEVAPDWIYMNGRSGHNPWKPHRTSWTSHNDGANFTAPYKCPIKEDNNEGCSTGMVSLQNDGARANKLFLSEPQGPGRIGLRVHCSLDGGATWPWSTLVGGENDRAAYSAMLVVNASLQGEETAGGAGRQDPSLLVVWEANDSEGKQNWKYTLLETDWCDGE